MSVKHAGISTMIKAEDLPKARTEAAAYIKDLYLQTEQALRTHIGGVKPRGEIIFSLDGPVPDPSVQSVLLQGTPEMVYVVTVAVPVETDDLPADCSAYVALKS